MEDEIVFKHVIPAQIRFSDVDQFGHMNKWKMKSFLST